MILTCLAENGEQVRLVAKGARKPKSSFSPRLELFSCAHVLAARGKSLDIVKEARLLCDNKNIRVSLERSAAASVLCELLARGSCVQVGVAHLFPMTCAALKCLGGCEISQVNTLCAAACLKAFSYLGFQPQFRQCVICGRDVAGVDAGGVNVSGADASSVDVAGASSSSSSSSVASRNSFAISYTDGGVVCQSCFTKCNCVRVSQATLKQARFLLFNTFSDILAQSKTATSEDGASHLANKCDTTSSAVTSKDALKSVMGERNAASSAATSESATDILQLCKAWARAQLGVNLKSMSFLLSLKSQ